MNNKRAAELIVQTLQYLKSNKISQKAAGDRINYTSLSKAKDHLKYPQVVIEKKTRKEVLEALFEEFGLSYDELKDTIVVSAIKTPQRPLDTMHYLMYYYSFARERIGMAWVQIIEKKKVLIDYRLEEHWEGHFEVVENYSFISAEKRGITTPVKKLICLFSGTTKYGRPILLGTYSTVKRDGFPAAGKVLLERVPDKKSALEKFDQEVDFRIINYLMDTVFTTLTYTPNNLEQLPKANLIGGIDGQYKVEIRSAQGQVKMTFYLTIFNSRRVRFSFNNTEYIGQLEVLDLINIKMDLKAKVDPKQSSPTLFFFFLKLKSSSGKIALVGEVMTNLWETGLESYGCEFKYIEGRIE